MNQWNLSKWINEIHVEFIFQMEGSVCIFPIFLRFFVFQFPRRWLFLNTTLRPLQRTSSTAVKKRTPFGVEDGTSKIFAMAVSSWYCWYRLAENIEKTEKNQPKIQKSSQTLPLFQLFINVFDFLGPKLHKKNNKTSTNPKNRQRRQPVQPGRWLVNHPPPITNQPSMPTSVAGG